MLCPGLAQFRFHLRHVNFEMNSLENLRAFVYDVLHLQETGGREVTDDVSQLQTYPTSVTKGKELLKNRGVLDDGDGNGAHFVQGHVVTEVGRAGGQHHLVSAESLSLHIDHDVTQATLHAQLIQVAQDRVTEVRDLQLNVPTLLHGCASCRCTALLERGRKYHR